MAEDHWKEAPEWANWRVRAADGKWFWFENMPVLTGDGYSSPGWLDTKSGKVQFAEFGVQEEGWAMSLEERPKLKLDQNNPEDEFVGFNKNNLGIGMHAILNTSNYTTSVTDQRGETVNHPSHYNKVPGIECIEVARHFNFNLGNAIKYIWRAGHKGNVIEDLRKAIWYLQDEINRLEKETNESDTVSN